jgi:hypothetical protein
MFGPSQCNRFHISNTQKFGKNKNMVISLERPRNQERLYWKGSEAIDLTGNNGRRPEAKNDCAD